MPPQNPATNPPDVAALLSLPQNQPCSSSLLCSSSSPALAAVVSDLIPLSRRKQTNHARFDRITRHTHTTPRIALLCSLQQTLSASWTTNPKFDQSAHKNPLSVFSLPPTRNPFCLFSAPPNIGLLFPAFATGLYDASPKRLESHSPLKYRVSGLSNQRWKRTALPRHATKINPYDSNAPTPPHFFNWSSIENLHKMLIKG